MSERFNWEQLQENLLCDVLDDITLNQMVFAADDAHAWPLPHYDEAVFWARMREADERSPAYTESMRSIMALAREHFKTWEVEEPPIRITVAYENGMWSAQLELPADHLSKLIEKPVSSYVRTTGVDTTPERALIKAFVDQKVEIRALMALDAETDASPS